MANVIFKFPLVITDEQFLDMYEGDSILTVQMQNGVPCIWAVCNPEATKIKRRIVCFGTGNPIKGHPGAYIGTVQSQGSSLIWHFFEQSF